jgi:hypothetical protein
VVGPASGPGWTGTRYAYALSEGPAPRVHMSGTVDVDQQGRTRSVSLVLTMGPHGWFVMTQVLTFSDFGTRVTVTPPPADQTIVLRLSS